MAEKIGNLIFLIIIFAFGLYYYMDVQSLLHFEERLIVEILFWFLMILLPLEGGRIIYKMVKESAGNFTFKQLLHSWFMNKPALLLTGLVIYVVLIPILGFFTASLTFIVVFNILLKSTKVWEITLLPVGVLTCIYFIFVYFLNIRLPEGVLF
ncbi:tripartite tricarboxylate transporter TctB family protein [Salsuginibacillus kocurii]|uniref:tripartite tricarboxylate transporter TctB family protein n=1 Tax=Salsuginibacillus kocurii TaxID=427078 RepID=UPI00036BE446|nr:tripartite tricarboxylate transporter TctB family protein [Salsuginibacillus kocurii]